MPTALAPALVHEVERLGGRLVPSLGPATVRSVIGPVAPPPAVAAFAWGVTWGPGRLCARDAPYPRGVALGGTCEDPADRGYGSAPLLVVGEDATQFLYVLRLDDRGDDPEVFRIDHEGGDGHPLSDSSRGPLSTFLAGLVSERVEAEPALALDERLALALRQALGGEGPLTRARLATLEEAALELPGVTSLAGLEACPALRRLTTTGYQLRDVLALAGLTRLVELRLLGAPVEDLSPLAGLAALERLSVGERALDLRPLAGLARLAWLQALGKLPSLEAVGPLEGLVELEVKTEAADLGPLARLRRLERLDLQAGAARDLAPLAGLERLAELSLAGGAFTTLAPLAGLSRLRRLALPWVKLPAGLDLLPPGVERLTLFRCDLERVDAVAPLRELRELDLSSNRLTDVTPLAALVKLEALDLSSNQVVDPTPLLALPALRRLSLGKNPVRPDLLAGFAPGVVRGL